jgi:glycosyltransferase involved in cell wall biosynthesis
MNKTVNPLVSICCLCYNHESYIRECLDGFMMQKTNFVFEVLIHDDASTDKSADIIREYEAKYLEIIKPIYQSENQFSKGVGVTMVYQFPRAQGKYIALCEGDDYWTDPYKLQKQVDFLEANEGYSLCFHRYDTYDIVTKKWGKDYCAHLFEKNGNLDISFNIQDLWNHWFAKTLTALFRNNNAVLENFNKYEYKRDVHLFYELLKIGKGICLSFNGGVYRLHNGGIHSKITDLQKQRSNFLVFKDIYHHNKRDRFIKKHLIQIIDNYSKQIKILLFIDNTWRDIFYIFIEDIKLRGLLSGFKRIYGILYPHLNDYTKQKLNILKVSIFKKTS